MDKVYLICYSTEEGTYTSHIAFATQELAEAEIKRMGKDGFDYYVIDAPLVTE